MSYFFKFKTGDYVKFGDLHGIVIGLDPNDRFGIEAEFIIENGRKEIGYFDSIGKLKSPSNENKDLRLEEDK